MAHAPSAGPACAAAGYSLKVRGNSRHKVEPHSAPWSARPRTATCYVPSRR